MAQIEFRLKIPPEEVRDLLRPYLEEYTEIVSLFVEKDWKTKFWGEVDSHYFSMRRKSSNRGYSNSYCPELSGSIRKTEYGSIVKILVGTNRKVARILKLNDFGLYGFTFIIGVIVFFGFVANIRGVFSGQSGCFQNFDKGEIIGVIVIGFIWGLRYIIKRWGKECMEEDEKIMTEFLENLFSEVKIDSTE